MTMFHFLHKKDGFPANETVPKEAAPEISDAASFDNDFYLIIRILPVYLIHIPSVDRTDLLQGIDHAIHGRSPDF